jgi:hypothetical protein
LNSRKEELLSVVVYEVKFNEVVGSNVLFVIDVVEKLTVVLVNIGRSEVSFIDIISNLKRRYKTTKLTQTKTNIITITQQILFQQDLEQQYDLDL